MAKIITLGYFCNFISSTCQSFRSSKRIDPSSHITGLHLRVCLCYHGILKLSAASPVETQMPHSVIPSSKHRTARPWRLFDIIVAAFFGTTIVYILVVFSPFGGKSSGLDPRYRQNVIALMESGQLPTPIEACPTEMVDHMPCENPKINSLLSREMNYYRERHCPRAEEMPLCLIPPPEGYRVPLRWPESLHKIWHANMPYSKIADRKGHQGWMKREGPYFIFPGGGTMFPDGAVQYIEKLKKYIPISGGGLRTALDMGCGVASFGGYMLSEGILTLSFAPRDSHKSQIQFALERGIPAFVAMLGTLRLPFPGFSFDIVHCSRCLIHFTEHNATYFLEVDRLLRPGGYLVISGPPVQWPKREKEWSDLQAVAKALCYQVITIDGNTVIWKKPERFPNQNEFGLVLCDKSDDPIPAWYIKLKKCVSRASDKGDYAVGTIPNWPQRLSKAPSRLNLVKNAVDHFATDNHKWMRRVAYYKHSLFIELGTLSIRNAMDMNSNFGGFAAALVSDPVWVMNVVHAANRLTLGIIYDRGLIGVYHDWCEPFSTYPRTYDLIHASDIESLLKDTTSKQSRCNLVDLMVEIDRMLRPEGTFVLRDTPEAIEKIERISRAIRWSSKVHETENGPDERTRVLVAAKTMWKLSSSISS